MPWALLSSIDPYHFTPLPGCLLLNITSILYSIRQWGRQSLDMDGHLGGEQGLSAHMQKYVEHIIQINLYGNVFARSHWYLTSVPSQCWKPQRIRDMN